jgi:cobalt-zinc-cadmium efflux system outer membrane protein
MACIKPYPGRRRRMRHIKTLTLMALLIGQSAPASAAPSTAGSSAPEASPPHPLRLEDAARLFRTRGLDLLLADAAVAYAAGAWRSASQIANPTVNLSIGRAFGYHSEMPLGPGGGASSVYLSAAVGDNGALLDLLFLHKRSLRTAVAQWAQKAVSCNRHDVERTLVSLVKQQWVGVAAAKKQLSLNEDLFHDSQQFEGLIQARFTSGAVSQVDLSMQKTVTYEAAQQVATARAALAQAKVLLGFLLGQRDPNLSLDVDDLTLETHPPLPVESMSPAALHALAEAHRPDLKASKWGQQGATTAHRLAGRLRWPDLQLSLNFVQQGTGQQAISPPTLAANLALTPPLFYAQQGEMAMAEANRNVQEIGLQKVRAQVYADVDAASAALQSATERLHRMDHGYLEQATLQYQLTKKQYAHGAASLADVITSRRLQITALAEWVQSLNDYWTTVFTMEAAIAQDFT